jgi:hypothetical protein
MNAQGTQPDQFGHCRDHRRSVFDRRGDGHARDANIRPTERGKPLDGSSIHPGGRGPHLHELVDVAGTEIGHSTDRFAGF